MHGGVVPLQLLQDAPGLLRREGLIERGRLVHVEIVEHQHDALGGGEVHIDQLAQLVGDVERGALRGHRDVAPAQVRGTDQEEIGAAVALVLGVFPRRMAGDGRQRRPDGAPQGLARLVEADQRPGRIGRPGIDGKDVFHRRREGAFSSGGIRKRRTNQGLARFFKRLADRLMTDLATISSSTTRAASKRSVQRAWPGGGARAGQGDQARFLGAAEHARGGKRRGRPCEALANPSRANMARTRATVRGSTPDRRGHRQIGLGRAAGAGHGGQQDAGAALLQGGGGIAAQQGAQPARSSGSDDDVLPVHGGAPLLRPLPATLRPRCHHGNIALTQY